RSWPRPQRGLRGVATGGASPRLRGERNPWKHSSHFPPRRGGGAVSLRPFGTAASRDLIPRVPLRSTRGYSPRPLRGQERGQPSTIEDVGKDQKSLKPTAQSGGKR